MKINIFYDKSSNKLKYFLVRTKKYKYNIIYDNNVFIYFNIFLYFNEFNNTTINNFKNLKKYK